MKILVWLGQLPTWHPLETINLPIHSKHFIMLIVIILQRTTYLVYIHPEIEKNIHEKNRRISNSVMGLDIKNTKLPEINKIFWYKK